MKKNGFILILLVLPLPNIAQRHEIYSPTVATLQVVANDNWQSLPIINLNSKEWIDVGFDDFSHQHKRYTYTIKHCEADWTISDNLFSSDFIDGFAENNTIDDIKESVCTNVLYTHYHVRLPNEKCQFKMSGNYKMEVYNDEDGEKVLNAFFMILDNQVSVQMEVSTNTDLDINNCHQQLSIQMNYRALNVVDPEQEIKTVIMMNNRWTTARTNIKPQYIMSDGLKWIHNKDLIFDAGNEYHKFEILDISHPTMGIERIEWDGNHYQVFPFIAEFRQNYLYDEDANGGYCIRNSENINKDNTSEYVFVNYRVSCPKAVRGNVYLNGSWTNDRLEPQYEMIYDKEKKLYTATILQKQGYYNYQLLWIDDSNTIRLLPTEGNYFQTENSYQSLIYYRGRGERTDLLVGYQEVKTI